MPILDLFHGADATKMLYNLQQGGLTTDSTGKLYFAQHQWTNCLVHGADSTRRESYVVMVRVTIPEPPIAEIERAPRAGNPDALIVTTTANTLLQCEFLEMYVRSGNREDGFHTRTVPADSIRATLEAPPA